jgi:uncharacterized repeat protein (TIGR03803 family)
VPKQRQQTASVLDINFQAKTIALVLVFIVATMTTPAAHAQTYTVLHNFTGHGDGSEPYAGLTMDRAGNFYGTTVYGGNLANCEDGCGVVFKLAQQGAGWVLSTIYTFQGGADGVAPFSGVTIGPDGSLYGTTYQGGMLSGCIGVGCGTVYKLTPPATICQSVSCPWTKTVLHEFTGADGDQPVYGNLTFDGAGNLYGTTEAGGAHDQGTVYELTPSNGGWTESVLWSFTGGDDGDQPSAGVIVDSAGNLYGTTFMGGAYQAGIVYELSPSGLGWTERTLLSLDGSYQGDEPIGGVAMDQHGNLYGTARLGGTSGGGTAFQLTPSGGAWTYHLMQAFPGIEGPFDTPTLDAAGNVYVTCTWTGGWGSLFELTPLDGGWNSNLLYSFTFGGGSVPVGSVLLDANGNIYGTASSGGGDGKGVVFEITP